MTSGRWRGRRAAEPRLSSNLGRGDDSLTPSTPVKAFDAQPVYPRSADISRSHDRYVFIQRELLNCQQVGQDVPGAAARFRLRAQDGNLMWLRYQARAHHPVAGFHVSRLWPDDGPAA